LSSGSVVRLFEGNGGATTAFWYSVTVQPGGPWTEREAFLAYSEPVVTGISCQGETIEVRPADGAWRIDAASFERGTLVPVRYWRGEESPAPECDGMSAVDWLRMSFGLCVLLAGVWVLARPAPCRRAGGSGAPPSPLRGT
jgi:hypothetical protein